MTSTGSPRGAIFRTKISEGGRDTYGARSGAHDDLVLSVAMGAWLATRDRWQIKKADKLSMGFSKGVVGVPPADVARAIHSTSYARQGGHKEPGPYGWE